MTPKKFSCSTEVTNSYFFLYSGDFWWRQQNQSLKKNSITNQPFDAEFSQLSSVQALLKTTEKKISVIFKSEGGQGLTKYCYILLRS